MAAEEFDRTEPATPFKLREARKRGQVAKSTDISAVSMLAVGSLVLFATASSIGDALSQCLENLILMASRLSMDVTTLGRLFSVSLQPLVIALSPLALALVVTAVVANMVQTGPVFSTHPLKPDFTRLNPAKGLKKIFARRTLFEFFKACIKVSLLGVIIWLGGRSYTGEIHALTAMEPGRVVPRWLELAAVAAAMLVLAFSATALLDLLFSRQDFARQMRMSRRELKDEHKRREGDPEVRSRRRRLQQELLKRSKSVAAVKDSDVVLVNPTHLAVALRYRPEEMLAPVITAMGAGALARRIRKAAHEHRVPVLRNMDLARSLSRHGSVGSPIPEEAYSQVAPIYRWLMALPGSGVRT